MSPFSCRMGALGNSAVHRQGDGNGSCEESRHRPIASISGPSTGIAVIHITCIGDTYTVSFTETVTDTTQTFEMRNPSKRLEFRAVRWSVFGVSEELERCVGKPLPISCKFFAY